MSDPESPVAVFTGLVAGTWHETAAEITAAALEQRRLAGNDIDAGQIAGKVPAACSAIDHRLDLRPVAGRVQYVVGGVPVITYAPGDAPGPILDAAVQLTLDLYDRKDARFGVLTSASASFGEPVRVSRDQLAGIESLIAPFVEGWGIG